MTASKIEWTGRSDWNPVRGCTRASEGCRHCYAEQIAGRFSGEGQPFHSFAARRGGEGRWTGRVELVEDRLTLPLRWRKPALVFASSTSDIFHESLPDEAIDRIFAVMALAPRHTFQVLTKRSARMRAYLSSDDARWRVLRAASNLCASTGPREAKVVAGALATWSLPNVWLGVSVEDQAAADARVPDLLATPAALRFLSCDPLLGPVHLGDWLYDDTPPVDDRGGPSINWIIAGGESGRGARPMHPDWARSLRVQCAEAGVPFLFKQWGEWAPGECAGNTVHQRIVRTADWFDATWQFETMRGDFELHADDEPTLFWAGKAAAGRLLDGVQHDGMPA